MKELFKKTIMARKSQKKKVLEHLMFTGTLTSWEAIQKYKCTRLADVIFRLKEDYIITTEMIIKTDDEGETVRFAKYRYVGRKSVN